MTWNTLSDKKNKVPWQHLVWFSQAIPRQSFMVLLAFHNRLATGDRMRTWDIEQCCMLCGESDETRDHLFFACPYSFTVWMNTAGRLLGDGITPDWDESIATLLHPTHNRIDNVLGRMSFQTVLYAVWKEKNSRCHGGGWKST